MDLIEYHDDNSEEIIFLINETGEDMFISHSNDLQVDLVNVLLIFHDVHSKVDQNTPLVSSCLITHERMSLTVANNHRLQENPSNIDDQCLQGEKKICFQVITKMRFSSLL